MSATSTDHNLLFGLLALQNDFVTREQLLAAVSAWLTDKSRSLEDILRERQSLSEKERQLLSSLVEMHLARHGGDTEKSLVSISTVSLVRDDLEQLADVDLHATLSLLPRRVGVPPAQKTAPPAGQAASSPPNGSLPDSRFKILRPHAKGGLGEVFLAKDLELNREVALKEIRKDRRYGRDEQTRFVLEAEVNGGLEHPGIVPVYGLGQYADGRPYYAMRFIRGDSLKEAIDRFHNVGRPSRLAGGCGSPEANHGEAPDKRLSDSAIRTPQSAFDSLDFRKLLTRFITVCNAIEYAHSRGVLHRDLKPANIMLGKYGETLVVDWGLAKIKGKDDQHKTSDEQTLLPRSAPDLTEQNSVMGTPAYMSPEQAAGRTTDLTPATDIYSLGATLYSLLTGQTPFAARGVGVSPAQRHPMAPVGHASPQKAAPRTSSENILDRVKAGDFPPPRQINPSIPKPLEAICLKAMALRPADRYCSSQELADDLERYLADEAVRALSEPVSLRARRWLRKHPRSVASLAATLLVGVTCSLLIASIVADRNRQLAASNIAERRAKNEAEAKRTEAEQARERAEKAETTAVANELTAKQERDRAEQEKQIAEAVKSFLQNRLLAQASASEQANTLLHETGSSANARANVTIRELLDRAAAELVEERIELQFPHLPLVQAEILRVIGDAYRSVDEYNRSIDHLERSHDIFLSHLGADDPGTLTTLQSLAEAYASAGRTAEAIALLEEIRNKRIEKLGSDDPYTLTTLNNLAVAYVIAGRTDEAIKLFEQVRDNRTKMIGADHPETLRTLNNLADQYQSAGRMAEAIALLEEVRDKKTSKLGPDHPDTLTSLHDLAFAYADAGRMAEAIALFEQVRDKRIEMLGPDDSSTLITLHSLALAYGRAGRNSEAIALLEQIRDKDIEKLGADHFNTLTTFHNLASAYSDAGRTGEAISIYEQVREKEFVKLGPDHPNTLKTISALAAEYHVVGRSAEAIALLEQVRDKLIKTPGPDHPDTLTALHNLAVAYSDAGRTGEAIPIYEQVRDKAIEKLGLHHPNTLKMQSNLATEYHHADRTAEAIALLEQVRDTLIEKLGPNNADLASTLNELAWLRATCSDERYRDSRQAIEHATKACELTGWKNSSYLDTLAAAYAEAGDFAKAVEWQQKAIAIDGSDDDLRAHLELYKSGKPYRQPLPKSSPPPADAPP